MLPRDHITMLVHKAVGLAQTSGILPTIEVPGPVVERPQNPDHGDFASSVPLRLSRGAGKSPMEIATALAELIPIDEVLESIWVAPPGFLNFRISSTWLQLQIDPIRAAPDSYGNTNTGGGRYVQVEFVSVNPTGPVHVGHARGAVLGSTLANALSAAGYKVVKEYYVNDAGTQISLFHSSVFARYAQALGHIEREVPEGGYQGAYLQHLGQSLADEFGSRFLDGGHEESVRAIGQIGLERMLVSIADDLGEIGVEFDVWFREKSLFESGEYSTVMGLLESNGYTVTRDGALWFTASTLGDDKDNVLVRRNGEPTYFASDVAYHYNKFVTRGFDVAIDIWGADHQGHVTRMKNVLTAVGLKSDMLTVLISQLVTLKRGGEVVRASKRTGELVTLKDLVDEVGADACRYFFLSRAAESQMEFDLELAKQQSAENPVYYVQYAHARIAGILRQATERGLAWEDGDSTALVDVSELALLRKMVQLPELIDSIATTLAPHALAHYAMDLASAFHWFYDHCRVLSDRPDDQHLVKARLKLCEASKVALSRTLGIMGVAAPDNM